MAQPTKKQKLHLSKMRELVKLSPFELKDKLIQLAADRAQGKARAADAQRRPRQPELDRHHAARGLLPARPVRARGVASASGTSPTSAACRRRRTSRQRFRAFLDRNSQRARGRCCCARRSTTAWISSASTPTLSCTSSPTASSATTTRCPTGCSSTASGSCTSTSMQEMCDGRPPRGKFDLFAVEGGTAAMCYIFDCLMRQRPAASRATRSRSARRCSRPTWRCRTSSAIGSRSCRSKPSEMAEEGCHTWQYPDAEIDKLADPRSRPFFLRQSEQPGLGGRSAQRSMKRLVDAGEDQAARPACCSPTTSTAPSSTGFRSLMAELPQNTIGVYSYSKYFGCTGWRLGVVAIHQNNVFDEQARRAARGGAQGARTSATARSRCSRRSSSSSIAWWPTAARWRSTTPPACRCRSRCRWRCSRCSPCSTRTTRTRSVTQQHRPRAVCASSRRAGRAAVGGPAPRQLLRRPSTCATGPMHEYGPEFDRVASSGSIPTIRCSAWPSAPAWCCSTAAASRPGLVGARVAGQPATMPPTSRSDASCAPSWTATARLGARSRRSGPSPCKKAAASNR